MYSRTVDRNPWIPDTVKLKGLRENAKQRQFLLFSDLNEVFYGGAAGGGKTYATLMAAAQFLDVPGYSALLLRENFADLAQPGAWIPLSYSWWNKKASWKEQARRWTFPSGATITFGYLERDQDVFQYDTASYQFIAIDELVQHTEWRYRFMFGRLRRPMEGPLSRVPVRMRSASNPGGKGHDWVKKRFIDPKSRECGAVFVPAKLEDNAGNMDTESYRRDSLSKLDPLLRAQRERGDWDAIEGGRFKPAWFPRYRITGDYLTFQRPGEAQGYTCHLWQCMRFGTLDPATSAKTSADYTVQGAWLMTPRYDLALIDVDRFQAEIPDQLPKVESFYNRWQLTYIGIEAVAANNALYQIARRSKMNVKMLSPMSQDKLVRATPAMVLAESGRIWLPERPLRAGAPIDEFESELYRFTGDDSKDDHDDCVDMLSYAVQCRAGATVTQGQAAPQIMGSQG